MTDSLSHILATDTRGGSARSFARCKGFPRVALIIAVITTKKFIQLPPLSTSTEIKVDAAFVIVDTSGRAKWILTPCLASW